LKIRMIMIIKYRLVFISQVVLHCWFDQMLHVSKMPSIVVFKFVIVAMENVVVEIYIV